MALKFTVRYDGTDYHGFQRQSYARTIQGTLEEVFQKLMGGDARILGASRTDAGVHAMGQVAVYLGACRIPMDRVALVVNRDLPKDIRIADVTRVEDDWDPRFQPSYKQYSYRVWRGPGTCPPALARTTATLKGSADWRWLQYGAPLVLGTHDFRAFRSAGSSAKTTVRRMVASRWDMVDEGTVWRYRVVGDGFLYHMVRHLVASQWRAALARSLEPLELALKEPGRLLDGPAPARGLTLDWIQYRGDAKEKM